MFWCGGRHFRSLVWIQANFLQLFNMLTLSLTFPVCEKIVLFPGSREPECPSPWRWHPERASWGLAQRPRLSQNQKLDLGPWWGGGSPHPNLWAADLSSLHHWLHPRTSLEFCRVGFVQVSLAYEKEKRYFKLRVVFVILIKAPLTLFFLPHN